MLLQNGLSINLCPSQVCFEFRLHNAFESERAVCYLKHGGGQKYFEWMRNRDAVEIARALRETVFQDDDLAEPYVIRSTKFFDLTSKAGYGQKLKRAVLTKFEPDVRGIVERVCFGTQSEPAAAPDS